MNLSLHPAMTILWVLQIAAAYWLIWRSLQDSSSWLFIAYCQVFMLQSAICFIFCYLEMWQWNWNIYWTGQVILHALTTVIILVYAFNEFSFNARLSETFHGNASLAIAGIVCASILARYWSVGVHAQVIRFLEIGCSVWIGGLAWIVLLAICPKRNLRQKDRVLIGFVILYSPTIVTSVLWASNPRPWPFVWCVEIGTQMAAIGWWIWALHTPQRGECEEA